MGLLFLWGGLPTLPQTSETSPDKRHHHAKTGRAINAAQRRNELRRVLLSVIKSFRVLKRFKLTMMFFIIQRHNSTF